MLIVQWAFNGWQWLCDESKETKATCDVVIRSLCICKPSHDAGRLPLPTLSSRPLFARALDYSSVAKLTK